MFKWYISQKRPTWSACKFAPPKPSIERSSLAVEADLSTHISSECYRSDRLVLTRVGHFSPLTEWKEKRNGWRAGHPQVIPGQQVDPLAGRVLEGYRSREGLSFVRGLTVPRYISRSGQPECRGVHAGVTQFVVTNEHNMIMLAVRAPIRPTVPSWLC